MKWNLNSLGKDNFSRIQMIEAHNSLFNYDIISLCETSLTKDSLADMPSLQEYMYVPANHPDNVSHGGIGLFYKETLPVIVRNDSESLILKSRIQQ